MNNIVPPLLARFADSKLSQADVIPWSCPVPVFGNLMTAYVGTVGLNPSNREFVDAAGNELNGLQRRFETLRSLGLSNWKGAQAADIQRILKSFQGYFGNNPYDGWFRRLDALISATHASYYYGTAAHLDLIPYATFRKWGNLSSMQRKVLLRASGNTLAVLLRDAPIRVLVLNGASVVANFQRMFELQLESSTVSQWSLRSKTDSPVIGLAYVATIKELADVSLKRRVLVLGFNHNIQSSFGVTREVTNSIRRWIGKISERAL